MGSGKCYDPRVFSKAAWMLHLRSSVIVGGGVAREPWILIAEESMMAALRIAWRWYREMWFSIIYYRTLYYNSQRFFLQCTCFHIHVSTHRSRAKGKQTKPTEASSLKLNKANPRF